MSIREKIEKDRENDLKKKASSIDEYDYKDENQSSIFKQQQYSTSRQLATFEIIFSMNPNAFGVSYIARRIDVNDKFVSIKQSRAVEKEKKNDRKTSHFRRAFRNGANSFGHNEA